MPCGVDFHIPFPSRISADVGRAERRHLDWPCSFGLLATEEARRRHARAKYADIGARFQPRAVGADLDLSVDQMSWFFIFDDLFDGPRGAPGPALELVSSVAKVLDRAPRQNAEPIVRAFADLWRRSRQEMSPAWQKRAADNWRDCLTGYVEEVDNRQRVHPLGIREYLRIRRHTIGIQPPLDLAERVGGFEMPARALTSELLATMRRLGKNMLIVHNDVCSVEKEEATGDANNLVLILERSRNLSRQEAIAIACALVRQWTTDFLAHERELPRFCESLGLDPAGRSAVKHYHVDGLRAVIRGTVDWSELTGRYAIARR
jgi:pentalenene synthase